MNKSSIFPQRGSEEEIEQGGVFMPRFDAHGLVPVIAQDATSGEILMFAFMNETALKATLESGEAHYWSRSRKELWHKGGTSGHTQKVKSIRVDCDQDVLLIRVEQVGGACHVGYDSCFFRELARDGSNDLTTVSEKSFNPKDVYPPQATSKPS